MSPSSIVLLNVFMFRISSIIEHASETDGLDNKKAEFPMISGIDDELYAITGHPAFCASKTGMPNPS